MPLLKDIKDGNVKVGALSVITYEGKTYRGKAIVELANKLYPDAPKKKRGSNARKRRTTKRSSAKPKQPAEQQAATDEPAAPEQDDQQQDES